MCVDVKSDRVDPIVKSQACHIMVYDYYEPGTLKVISKQRLVQSEPQITALYLNC